MTSEADVLQLMQQQLDSLKASREQQLQADAAKAASEERLRAATIKCAQGLVRLNVGGCKYTTSLTTLLAVPDSYFTALFSGDWQLALTAEGDLFLDIDGEVFKHVLRYLRAVRDQQTFLLSESLSQEAIAAIAAEAQFFGLHDLTTMLMTKQQCTGYKYKYVKVDSSGSAYYAPYQDRNGSYYTWQKAKKDEANLDTLQEAGWEYVCSHAAGGECAFVVVLRRMNQLCT